MEALPTTDSAQSLRQPPGDSSASKGQGSRDGNSLDLELEAVSVPVRAPAPGENPGAQTELGQCVAFESAGACEDVAALVVERQHQKTVVGDDAEKITQATGGVCCDDQGIIADGKGTGDAAIEIYSKCGRSALEGSGARIYLIEPKDVRVVEVWSGSGEVSGIGRTAAADHHIVAILLDGEHNGGMGCD